METGENVNVYIDMEYESGAGYVLWSLRVE